MVDALHRPDSFSRPFVGRVWLRGSRRCIRSLETVCIHPAGQTVAESTVDCVSADTCTNSPRASKVSVREFANSAALVLSQATEVTTVIVNGAAVPSRLQVLLFAVIPPPGRLVGPSLRPSAPRITTI